MQFDNIKMSTVVEQQSKAVQRIGGLVMTLLVVAGCSSDIDVLRKEIDEIRKRPGERIEAMREIKPYEAFVYNASTIRSPFTPSAPALTDVSSALRPDSKRAREYLEQFPLDSLKMVGILELQGRKYGLVQDKQGLVHRLLPGNYLGQADGRITGITSTKISVIQIVPDGLGGYIEKPTALALAE
jgi:type IV pilus assembly protein PilP